MNKILKVYFCVVLLGWMLSVHATTPDAGWVYNFDGKPSIYTLKRGEEIQNVTLLMLLKVGDEISVKDKQHAIELGLGGGTQLVKVTVENSPFQIKQAHQVSDELKELWEWTKQHFNEWNKLQQSLDFCQPTPKKLTMPLLANAKEAAVLIAGKRALHLQWYGGKPPYQVEIKQRRTQLQILTTQDTTIKTRPLNFKAGKPYRVVIKDAEGEQIQRGFKAIPSAQSYPQVLQDARLLEETRRILEATWLIRQDDGKWIFEVYQQILETSQSTQMLKTVLLQLETFTRGISRGVRGVRGIRNMSGEEDNSKCVE